MKKHLQKVAVKSRTNRRRRTLVSCVAVVNADGRRPTKKDNKGRKAARRTPGLLAGWSRRRRRLGHVARRIIATGSKLTRPIRYSHPRCLLACLKATKHSRQEPGN